MSIESNLHEMLEQETEQKAPSIGAKMWDFSDDGEIIEETAPETETAQENEKQAPVKTTKDKEKIQKASAETATASIDALLDLFGGFAISAKFKNSFAPGEIELLNDFLDRPFETLTDDQKTLVTKYNRLKSKMDNKMQNLPFTENTTSRLNAVFENYFRITGKELSPEFLLIMGIGSAIADKATTIFID